MTKEDPLPYELQKYLSKEQTDIIDANTADYRPTTRATLDSAREKSIELYNAGLEVLKKIDAANLERCKRLYKIRHGNTYRQDELCRERVLGWWVLVPRYVTFIEEARILKEALA